MSAEVEAKVPDPTTNTESKAEEVKPVADDSTTTAAKDSADATEGAKADNDKSMWDFLSHLTPAAAASLRKAARDPSVWSSLRNHILTTHTDSSEKANGEENDENQHVDDQLEVVETSKKRQLKRLTIKMIVFTVVQMAVLGYFQ